MSIDTIGGFGGNRSTKKNMHLLVDHFTRFAWILTSSTQTAIDFIKLISPIVKNKNIKMLMIDQYSGLNSSKFKEYLKHQNVQIIFTAVDNPQSNGLNERLNQTLVNRIHCKINENINRNRPWTILAEECVKEYNNTIHSSTKFSPAFLVFGETSEIVPESLKSTNYDIQEARNESLINTMKNFHFNKRRIDRNRKNHEFTEGDLVYVSNGNKLNRNKLDEIRRGPFIITKRISGCIFEVGCRKKRKEANFFHASKLVPYSFSEEKESSGEEDVNLNLCA